MTRPRPCSCDNHVPGGPFVRGRDCARCWLWHNNPTYREGLSAPVLLPCVHIGDSLTGYECAAAGVDPRRDWKRCGLGLSVGGSPPGVVCRCKGCGPTCAGYTPGETGSS